MMCRNICPGLFILLVSFLLFSCRDASSIASGSWMVSYDPESRGVRLEKEGKKIYGSIYASYKLSGRLITTRDYTLSEVKREVAEDVGGKAFVFRLTFEKTGLPLLTQSFYLYPDKDYVLTDFMLEDQTEIASNYMAPVVIDSMPPVLEEGDNRALFIPFDNDKWIRYQSCPLTFDKLTSYEVTAIFNNQTRKGWVVGSVEHDLWKSAIEIGKGNPHHPGALTCYGGVADSLTRDVRPHGAVRGHRIKSPRAFLGFFDDWRVGLEHYAKANASIAPPKKRSQSVPFGWNSWGVLQFNLTYSKALEVSDFFKKQLQDHHFLNPDRTVVIGLDSGWNRFTEEELKSFVAHCKANGQKAGIYWTPFTDWGKDPERMMNDAPGFQYKAVYLYADGKPQELDGAYAIDPTHPAVEQQMKKISDLFRRAGFEYVKMDFMTHGALEADQWYRPEIQTGIQAYNYGMKLLDKYFGDMYINLSISPVFPAHYAESRRIACDAWNKIKDTEYTMNASSYGWWQNQIYNYNDADHVVLQEATGGENRARITSAIVTGMFITGDDFSLAGSSEGKQKAVKYLTNPEVNAVATGRAFRPVEGNGEFSESQFVRQEEDGTFYLVLFNYGEQEVKTTVGLDRIGLDRSKEYQMKELWSGKNVPVKESFEVVIPAKDALLFKYKNN